MKQIVRTWWVWKRILSLVLMIINTTSISSPIPLLLLNISTRNHMSKTLNITSDATIFLQSRKKMLHLSHKKNSWDTQREQLFPIFLWKTLLCPFYVRNFSRHTIYCTKWERLLPNKIHCFWKFHCKQLLWFHTQ